MVSWALAAIVAWLSLLPANESGPTSSLTPGGIVGGLPDSPRKLVGRVVARLVSEGIPLERVRWLLGEHQPRRKPLPTGGLVGGVRFTRFDYADYGLSVDFVSDSDGVLRVSRVSRDP
jgi:hypothetical protein